MKDLNTRATVEGFQKWVFGEVLPSLRRGQIPTQRQPAEVDVTQVDRKALALMVIAEAEAREAAELRADVAETKAIEPPRKSRRSSPSR